VTARKNPDLRDVLAEGNDADGQDVTNVGSLQIVVPETGDYPDAPFRLSLPDDFADNADWGVILRIGPADDPNPAHALFAVDAFGGLVFRALLGQGAFPLMRLTSQDDPNTYLVAGPSGLQMLVPTDADFDQEVLGIGTVADGFIFDVEKDGSVFFNGSLYFQKRAIPVALTSGSKLAVGFDDTDGAVKLKIVATSADGTNVATDIPIGDDIATQADIAAEASARSTADAGKQPLDPDLTAFAALDSSTAGVAATDGAGWIKKTYAQFKSALSLVASDVGLGNVTNDAQLKASQLDTDGAFAANSDTRVPSQKAVKTYADALIAANDAMVFKGVIDASGNPNYPAADRGHAYKISVAGKIGGASGLNVEVGDLILCITDGTSAGTQAAVGANWTVVQTNLDGAVIGPASATDGAIATYSGTSGKVVQDSAKTISTDGTFASNSDAKVPTEKATKTYVDAEASARATADGLLVAKSLYDANTILKADSDDTPAALAMGASTILARLAAGGIVAATPAQLRTLLSLVVGTDVQAHDADLDTYAGITPSAIAQSILAAANAAAVRTLLGLGGLDGKAYVTGKYYMNIMSGPGGSSSALTNGTLYALPFMVRAAFTADRIGFFQAANGTATTVHRLGIYNDDGSGRPGTLLLDAGSIAGDSGGSVQKDITISQALTPGLYWLVYVSQVAAGGSVFGNALASGWINPLFAGTAANSQGGAYSVTGVSGALPTPFGTPTLVTSGTMPTLSLRAT
jgi:hypothetical protein